MATRKAAVKKVNPSELYKEIQRLENLIARQDDQLFQLSDELKDAKEQSEFCRKQINHYIALINILTRGA
jgi:hypothetical protein